MSSIKNQGFVVFEAIPDLFTHPVPPFQMITKKDQMVTCTKFTLHERHGLNHETFANPTAPTWPCHGMKKPTMSFGSWSKPKASLLHLQEWESTTEKQRESG